MTVTGVKLQKMTEDGYGSLFYAVPNRLDDISFRLEKDVVEKLEFLAKAPKCHENCQSTYNNKKKL